MGEEPTCCDSLDVVYFVNVYMNYFVQVWNFKGRELKSTISVGSPPVKIAYHPGNGSILYFHFLYQPHGFKILGLVFLVGKFPEILCFDRKRRAYVHTGHWAKL